MKLWIKLTVAVLIVGLIIFGYSKYKSGQTAKVTYTTTTVTRGTLVVFTTASGQISSANSASVTTQAGGVVSKVYVKNDQLVRTGTPLVQIDLDLVTQQKYQAALSSYRSAQNAINTLQINLFVTNQKLINDAVARNLAWNDPTYIEQEADWKGAENNYLNQQLQITSTWLSLQQVSPIVYAPISGTVTGLALQPGTVLTTAQKIASIKTNANPILTLNITEIDAPKIKIDNKATVTLDSLSGKTYTGRVVSVDTVGVVSSGVTSYPATIVFDTKPKEVLPNMAATASIITNSKDDCLMVPSTAVKTQNGQTYVQVMKNNTPQNVNVETGLVSDSDTEIISGLSEGDIVVTATINPATKATTTSTQSIFSGLNRGAVRRGN